jgi:aminoglycoside phosphotransferase (APT) family kinase protein
VEMFKGGQSNPTYKLITPARSYVMRAKPGRWPSCCRRRTPWSASLPSCAACRAPRCAGAAMYCLCEDEAVIGRAFYIMEFMQGRVLWDQSLPGMSGRARRHLQRDEPRHLGAAHGQVRRARPGSYGKPGNYFERQIGRWSKQYVASITQPIAEMDELMAWLPATCRPAPATKAACPSCMATTGWTT